MTDTHSVGGKLGQSTWCTRSRYLEFPPNSDERRPTHSKMCIHSQNEQKGMEGAEKLVQRNSRQWKTGRALWSRTLLKSFIQGDPVGSGSCTKGPPQPRSQRGPTQCWDSELACSAQSDHQYSAWFSNGFSSLVPTAEPTETGAPTDSLAVGGQRLRSDPI